MVPRRSMFSRLLPAWPVLALSACFLTLIFIPGLRFWGTHRSHASVQAVAEISSGNVSAPNQPRPTGYGRLPLGFEANRGQTDGHVKFISRGSAYTLFLGSNESVFASRAGDESSALRVKLIGANPSSTISGIEELPGKSNYFIGNDRSKWLTNVPTYSRVKYRNAYPGVDLVYYGNQQQLEYDFLVAPGVDPHVITLALTQEQHSASSSKQSGKPPHIDANGDLQIGSGPEELRFHKPVVYQESSDSESDHRDLAGNTAKHFVDGRWVLKSATQVGFEVGAYDASKAIVIDPVVSYSGYLGGSDIDVGNGVVVDSAGNAYIAGRAQSINFPTTTATYQSKNAGSSDAFVTKLNPSGSALIYSTYIGGESSDIGFGVALDPTTGNAYVTGATTSANFPVTPGAYQTTCGGGCNGAGGSAVFVTELNSTGSALIYSTYIGGSGTDTAIAFGIALDPAGEAYVTGRTSSATFPTTSGAIQTTFGGVQDAFVSKVNATGSALVYSTYLGGSALDLAIGIKVDSLGNAYVAGNTSSSNFPVTTGAYQTTCASSCSSADAFVTKLSPDGSKLIYSTFLGGTSSDDATAVAIDSAGNAYAAGFTCSTNFPITPGAAQSVYGGVKACSNLGGDAFVTKLNAAGSALLYSTYIGGNGNDAAFAVGVDSKGNAWVSGSTNSTNFPATPGAFQIGLLGPGDVFVTEVNAAGSAFAYSTYLGGTGTEVSYGLTVDSADNPYIVGKTASTDFPISVNPFQAINGGGGSDAFITKFAPGDQLWPTSLSFGSHEIASSSSPLVATLSNSGTSALTIGSITITGLDISDYSLTDTCGTSLAAGAKCDISVTFTPTAAATRYGILTVMDAATNSPQLVKLTGIGTTSSMTLSVASLTFGNQLVATSSVPQKATMANTGSTTVNIASIVATGPYTQTNNCGTTLAVAASCTVNVVFKPTTFGAQTGSISFNDDEEGSPQKLALTGNGTVMSFSPTSLSFGAQKVDTSSLPQNLTLTNLGTTSVTISKISIVGTHVSSFSETNNCPATLAASASCTITVTFTPQLTGLVTTALSVADTGGGTTQTVALSGTGQ
jgi:Cep192 domain 4/Beta-propeller repeat/HYDIN/CFA65/VesB-like, Ig-like domain